MIRAEGEKNGLRKTAGKKITESCPMQSSIEPWEKAVAYKGASAKKEGRRVIREDRPPTAREGRGGGAAEWGS